MADVHDWYGLAIRRFNHGQTVLVPIAWDGEEKPAFKPAESEYESVDYAWYDSKAEMLEAARDAAAAGYEVKGFPEQEGGTR